MPLSILVPLMLQVGPGGGLPQAPLQIPRKKSAAVARSMPETAKAANDPLKACLTLAMARPTDAIDTAENLLTKAKAPRDRAGAKQCQALALTQMGDWTKAAPMFLAARDDTAEPDARARLAALSGNASLAAQDPAGALHALDLARADLGEDGDSRLRSAIAVDRASALVALNRPAEAATALAEARSADPANAEAWLLSATLSRRQSDLAAAQSQIEKAAELSPLDPDIGLEAGVIAMLLGHEETARKSWRSVIRAAPGSAAAKTAQGYIDQLGAPTQP